MTRTKEKNYDELYREQGSYRCDFVTQKVTFLDRKQMSFFTEGRKIFGLVEETKSGSLRLELVSIP